MPHQMQARSLLRRRLAAGTVAVAAMAALAGTAPAALAASSPPPVTILSSSGQAGRGDIFVTPTGDTAQYANGPEILDHQGNVVWFHAIPQGLTASDFRVQRYQGRPVLTATPR